MPKAKLLSLLVGVLLGALLVAPNAVSATALPSTISEDMTLTPAGNPYTGGYVTIKPGVTVKAEPGVKLVLLELKVEGTLKAEGTAESPVRFAGAKEKEAGEWRSIFFKPGSGASALSHVEVANGGWRDSGYFNCNNGAITVEGSSPTISSSIIRDSCGGGIRVPEGGGPEIANNEFFKPGNFGIAYNAGSGQSGEINIHGNFIEGGAAGIQAVVNAGATVNAKTLSGATADIDEVV